jgi:hypothetical protein
VAPQLGGELPPHRLDGLEGDLEAARVVVARRSPDPPKARITPDPWRTMSRPAAREVRNVVRTAVSAVSAVPPAPRMSAATLSRLAWWRPAGKTRAPSRAKALAAAPPMAPPPP